MSTSSMSTRKSNFRPCYNLSNFHGSIVLHGNLPFLADLSSFYPDTAIPFVVYLSGQDSQHLSNALEALAMPPQLVEFMDSLKTQKPTFTPGFKMVDFGDTLIVSASMRFWGVLNRAVSQNIRTGGQRINLPPFIASLSACTAKQIVDTISPQILPAPLASFLYALKGFTESKDNDGNQAA